MRFRGTQTKVDPKTGKTVDRTVKMGWSDGEKFEENTSISTKMTSFATNIIAKDRERLRDKS